MNWLKYERGVYACFGKCQRFFVNMGLCDALRVAGQL